MALRSSRATAESAGTLVSGDVRRHNLSIVARYLLENGPSSRSQIADGTGLTRGSVTALTSVLLEAAIVREASPENARGKGRPLTLLNLAADHVAILALQLDADQVTGFLTTITGEPLVRIAEPHGRPMGNPNPSLTSWLPSWARPLTPARTWAAPGGHDRRRFRAGGRGTARRHRGHRPGLGSGRCAGRAPAARTPHAPGRVAGFRRAAGGFGRARPARRHPGHDLHQEQLGHRRGHHPQRRRRRGRPPAGRGLRAHADRARRRALRLRAARLPRDGCRARRRPARGGPGAAVGREGARGGAGRIHRPRPGPRSTALAAWDGACRVDRPGAADPGHVDGPAGHRPGWLLGATGGLRGGTFCRHPTCDLARCVTAGDRRGARPIGRGCRTAGRDLERPGQVVAGSAQNYI